MHFTQKENLKKSLDRLLSPPPIFSNLTYADRFLSYIKALKTGKLHYKQIPGFVKLCLFFLLAFAFLPIALILKILRYRFVNIDMSQIGSVVYLDLLLREDRLGRNTPRYKILVLASTYTDGNPYLMNLYSDYCIYVRNPLFKFILAPFFISPVFRDNSFKYDFVYHTETVAHAIWNSYAEKYCAPLIRMPQQDVEKCRKLLSQCFSDAVPFVALHIRDSGFNNDSARTTRNADIQTYKKAIQYLIERGYAVVRLGHPSADNIEDMLKSCGPMLFDYAHSDMRSDMMDCFLISQCAFFIGLASGPSSVPMLFNVNSCNVNWYNASNATNFLTGDLTSFKKLYYQKDRRLVPLERLMHPPFSLNASQKALESEEVELENNSAEEIYETVKEFLERPDSAPSVLQSKAKELIRKENYGYGAKGNFSNTILKLYEDELLGEDRQS